jgi:aminomethyltransferase
MVGFAGYDMPVQYASVIAEAKSVREAAGMFDVSHMARLGLVGGGVLTFLERVTTNDVSALGNGVGQYSLLPNASGGVVDDIIVYRVDEGECQMVVNAANHAKDVAWLKANNAEAVAIEDETDATFMIAVQGPAAIDTLCTKLGGVDALREAPAFGVVQTELAGIPVFAARSGYTGEDGYELIGPAGAAPELWNGLKAAGVVPCGLASRDTLRVEAGLPLYGHELTDEINPIETGLGWVVSKTKSFIGSDPINAARANGTSRKLLGVKLSSKRLMVPGMAISVDGAVVGEVTSGVYSPVLECGIAFAYVDAKVGLNTPCSVDIRGAAEPGTIVSKRFYKRAG